MIILGINILYMILPSKQSKEQWVDLNIYNTCQKLQLQSQGGGIQFAHGRIKPQDIQIKIYKIKESAHPNVITSIKKMTKKIPWRIKSQDLQTTK